MTKSFVKHFDSRFGSDFSGLRAADAVRDDEDTMRLVRQIGIFVERALVA